MAGFVCFSRFLWVGTSAWAKMPRDPPVKDTSRYHFDGRNQVDDFGQWRIELGLHLTKRGDLSKFEIT